MEKVNIFGFNFLSMNDYDNLLWELENGVELQQGELPFLITPNVDQVVKYNRRENANLRAQMAKAKYILPDGQPLVWVSKLTSRKLRSRLTGSDFFPQLWRHIVKTNRSTAFIVSSQKVVDRLKEERPSISSFIPSFYSLDDAKHEAIINEAAFTLLKEEHPEYLIIGLGYPKQERLAISLLAKCEQEDIEPPFMFLLGASAEFYTKVKKRAPQLYRRVGLEFMHRFFSEPRRMLKRYFIDDLAFFPLALHEILKKTP